MTNLHETMMQQAEQHALNELKVIVTPQVRHREAAKRLAVAIQEIAGLPRPAKSAGLAMTAPGELLIFY